MWDESFDAEKIGAWFLPHTSAGFTTLRSVAYQRTKLQRRTDPRRFGDHVISEFSAG
jgi:hypothetical protein